MQYKGYIITQAPNNHIMISKDERMIFHAQCKAKKTEEELKKIVDNLSKI